MAAILRASIEYYVSIRIVNCCNIAIALIDFKKAKQRPKLATSLIATAPVKCRAVPHASPQNDSPQRNASASLERQTVSKIEKLPPDCWVRCAIPNCRGPVSSRRTLQL